jgi:HSP20 family protein
MSDDEDYPDWFKKRRRFPFFRGFFFEDFDEIFKEMEKLMEKEFKSFTSRIPKGYVRTRRLPDGTTTREWGPFVYGYSMTIGPDGRPQVREFGNIQPTRRGAPQIREQREPLVDVIDTNGEVKVVAELPGVEKKDVKLRGTENALTISVDTPQRKFFKKVELPTNAKPQKAKTSYKNGVLEVTMPKVGKKREGEPIEIE